MARKATLKTVTTDLADLVEAYLAAPDGSIERSTLEAQLVATVGPFSSVDPDYPAGDTDYARNARLSNLHYLVANYTPDDDTEETRMEWEVQ